MLISADEFVRRVTGASPEAVAGRVVAGVVELDGATIVQPDWRDCSFGASVHIGNAVAARGLDLSGAVLAGDLVIRSLDFESGALSLRHLEAQGDVVLDDVRCERIDASRATVQSLVELVRVVADSVDFAYSSAGAIRLVEVTVGELSLASARLRAYFRIAGSTVRRSLSAPRVSGTADFQTTIPASNGNTAVSVIGALDLSAGTWSSLDLRGLCFSDAGTPGVPCISARDILIPGRLVLGSGQFWGTAAEQFVLDMRGSQVRQLDLGTSLPGRADFSNAVIGSSGPRHVGTTAACAG